ncbi:MAG TPA: hypothetical protein VFG72_03430 [Marmoricola sp.]|nr:hypothetical protein [Marmoricola sp.]
MAAVTALPRRAADPQLRTTSNERAVELPRWGIYTSFARRYAALIALCSLLGLGLGLGTALAQPASYSATASVMLTPVPTYASADGSTRPERVTIDSDAQLALSTPVVSEVARTLDTSPERVEERVSLRAVELSQVLELTYTAGSPTDARAGAQALVDAFVEARNASLLAIGSEQIERVGAQLRVIENRLVQRFRANPLITPEEPLLQEFTVIRARVQELEAARLQATEIINQPVEPSRPDSRDLEVPGTSGLMAGLLLATCLGALRDRIHAGRNRRAARAVRRQEGEHDPPASRRQVESIEAITWDGRGEKV